MKSIHNFQVFTTNKTTQVKPGGIDQRREISREKKVFKNVRGQFKILSECFYPKHICRIQNT